MTDLAINSAKPAAIATWADYSAMMLLLVAYITGFCNKRTFL
ncbi:hypothetical protein [Nostoc sp. UHCC 0302]